MAGAYKNKGERIMPVRCIKKIIERSDSDYGDHKRIKVLFPRSIIYDYSIRWDDIFVCEFKRHFDKNENLIREINENERIKGFDSVYEDFDLKNSSIAKKYGFCTGEYIEIIFQSIERMRERKVGRFFTKTKEEAVTIPIFPERTVEDLDFALK
jgi:hypothetical protein